MNLKKVGHRILALSLSLALALSSAFAMPEASYAAGRFSDTAGHWAEQFISRAYNLNIVSGYPTGKFMPDKAVTRAEFVSMINSALDLNSSSYFNTDLKDVLAGQWYYRDVTAAMTAGYAGGYSDNTFRPNNYISRQEAAVMLARVIPDYKGKGSLKSFKDYRQVAQWATAAMEKMNGRQYMGAYSDGRLHPADPLTRAQTAKILCDILDNETIEKTDKIVDENNTKLTERVYVGDVVIDEDLGEGSATIDNCVILGTLYVEGGGSKSVTINNARIANMVVRKDDTPVRIVTKGDTVIPKATASRSSILQTSGKNGYGILEVTVNKGAELTLKGNFPVVKVSGSTAAVTLESGKIDTLTVERSGMYSDITLTGKASVTEATVNGESYFHGTGIIAHMNVNADNITYETKPQKMAVGVNIDRAVGEADTKSDVEVEFDPDNKDTNVNLDAKITLTFNTSVKLANGTAITSSNIKNFATLRAASRGGIEVECTGTINAAKKVVTLTPKNELSSNARYYVVLADESIMNANSSKNDEEYVYFTTGSTGSNSLATYRPRDGATGVATDPTITIDFSEDVVKYSDGKEVTDSDLKECIAFRMGEDGKGSAVAYTASIRSQDTITIKPSSPLTPGETYYVAVIANKLKTKAGGKAVSGSSASWRVAYASPVTTPSAATLSTLTLAPSGGSNVLTGFSPSRFSYDVTVPFGTPSVDVTAAAVSGTSITINGSPATSSAGIALVPGNITAIKVAAAASGAAISTYQLSVEVAGNTSLSGITVGGISLVPGSSPYSANVPTSATSVPISISTVDPNAVIKINGGSPGTGSLSADIGLNPGSLSQTITFTVMSNRTTKEYTIYISRHL